MKKCCVFIGSEFVGLYISLGKLLQSYYDITFIVSNKITKNIVLKAIPEVKVIIFNEIKIPYMDDDIVVKESLRIEKLYGKTMSIIMSEDRALGRGYLFNVTSVPFIKRSVWPHKKKLKEIVSIILRNEIVCRGCDLALKVNSDSIVHSILSKHNGKILTLFSIKDGDRIYWCDDHYLAGSNFKDRVLRNIEIDAKIDLNLENNTYKIDQHSNIKNISAKYSYVNAIKSAINLVINEIKVTIRRSRKTDSYLVLGWLPSVFRAPYNYNFLKKIGKKPEDLTGYKIVFFPLHMEPEIALLSRSPEFSNSMEVITWVSKSLPADTILVCKEQPLTFGVRPKKYYSQIDMIGNVCWSHPDVHSWDWIESSNIIVTITGTVGIEAVHHKKPVISFGAHQVINLLPTVQYVDSYKTTKNAIEYFLDNNTYKFNSLLDKSRLVLSDAQHFTSFEFKEYKSIVKSQEQCDNFATTLIDKMFESYPDIKTNQ